MPLSTLRRRPHRRRRMTRGRRGSLPLRRRALPSPPPCRFIPALRKVRQNQIIRRFTKQRVHELPGTTFSNPAERGGYDSDRQAALTLDELTRWLALAVASYHGTVHSTLRQTPAGAWAAGVARDGTPPVVVDRTGFLVDFLPVLRRRITRVGFVIDHVHYFGNVLKPWIARRDRLGLSSATL